MGLSVDDFDFELPAELIAQQPAAVRSSSRLLCVGSEGALADRGFADLPDCLRPGDLLILNDTQVIKARLHGHRDSGGKVELLIERFDHDGTARAHVRASHPPRAGTRLLIGDPPHQMTIDVTGRAHDLFMLRLTDGTWDALLAAHGSVPLPPYIRHTPAAEDEARYQTVYARSPGAVAAPTAGLHFDSPLFEALRSRGVEVAWLTLHVGAGTFQPMRTASVAEHHMHSERYFIPPVTVTAVDAARGRGGRVVAVGTTCVRALEASADERGRLRRLEGDTDLFITPGFRFRVVDRLITNFHLPRSTLLMLVSAFAGYEQIRHAYAHAVAARYRFFSYGDAMLLERQTAPGTS